MNSIKSYSGSSFLILRYGVLCISSHLCHQDFILGITILSRWDLHHVDIVSFTPLSTIRPFGFHLVIPSWAVVQALKFVPHSSSTTQIFPFNQVVWYLFCDSSHLERRCKSLSLFLDIHHASSNSITSTSSSLHYVQVLWLLICDSFFLSGRVGPSICSLNTSVSIVALAQLQHGSNWSKLLPPHYIQVFGLQFVVPSAWAAVRIIWIVSKSSRFSSQLQRGSSRAPAQLQ